MNPYRNDFPILAQTIHGKPLVYLDNSATSQKPNCVIEAVAHYYRSDHANVHRGVHQLSERATDAYEKTRRKIQQMVHAKHAHEIIFTSGTTASINLVAHSFARTFLHAGDEIIISVMEHHSNIVPWQLLQEQYGIQLRVVPISDLGELDLEYYKNIFSKRTKLVALAHASNVLGTINPLKEIIHIAHAYHVPVLIDGAQAFPHIPVDMQELDCDFYTFSAHKAYGPTGVGVLYGKTAWLEKMLPYQGGGAMIESVMFEKTTYSGLPYKFEAGTPNIAGVVGFYAALDYLDKISLQKIAAEEHALLRYAMEKLSAVPGLRMIGTAANKVGVLSFVLDGIHPHDIGTIMDHEGIALRVGHHCAMPLMEHFNIPACVRASIGLYNTRADIDRLVAGVLAVQAFFNVPASNTKRHIYG